MLAGLVLGLGWPAERPGGQQADRVAAALAPAKASQQAGELGKPVALDSTWQVVAPNTEIDSSTVAHPWYNSPPPPAPISTLKATSGSTCAAAGLSDLTSEEHCIAAKKTAGPDAVGVDVLSLESGEDDPPGCFTYVAFGKLRYYWNQGTGSKGREGRTPVCNMQNPAPGSQEAPKAPASQEAPTAPGSQEKQLPTEIFAKVPAPLALESAPAAVAPAAVAPAAIAPATVNPPAVNPPAVAAAVVTVAPAAVATAGGATTVAPAKKGGTVIPTGDVATVAPADDVATVAPATDVATVAPAHDVVQVGATPGVAATAIAPGAGATPAEEIINPNRGAADRAAASDSSQGSTGTGDNIVPETETLPYENLTRVAEGEFQVVGPSTTKEDEQQAAHAWYASPPPPAAARPGHMGSTCASSGLADLTSLDECKAAKEAAGPTAKGVESLENGDDDPPGCFTYVAFGKLHYYWNKGGKLSKGRISRTPICTEDGVPKVKMEKLAPPPKMPRTLVVTVANSKEDTISRMRTSMLSQPDLDFGVVLYTGNVSSWSTLQKEALGMNRTLLVQQGALPPGVTPGPKQGFIPKLWFQTQVSFWLPGYEYVWLIDDDISFRNFDAGEFWGRHQGLFMQGPPLVAQPTIRQNTQYPMLMTNANQWPNGTLAAVSNVVEQQAPLVDVAYWLWLVPQLSWLSRKQVEMRNDWMTDHAWCPGTDTYQSSRTGCAIINTPIDHDDTQSSGWMREAEQYQSRGSTVDLWSRSMESEMPDWYKKQEFAEYWPPAVAQTFPRFAKPPATVAPEGDCIPRRTCPSAPLLKFHYKGHEQGPASQ